VEDRAFTYGWYVIHIGETQTSSPSRCSPQRTSAMMLSVEP